MISKCGDSCCRGNIISSNTIPCGWFVGYAQPGKPRPCGKYEDAIRSANNPTIPSEDMTKWINVGIDKAISDSKNCYPLVAGEAGSLRECQAKCSAREYCNTVNWHARNEICKQFMCLKQIGMGTQQILGYDIFTWITTKAGEVCKNSNSLTFQWHVGAWGSCLNVPNYTSGWRFTPPVKWSDCELVKNRTVACIGTDGKTYPGSFCSSGGRGKPQVTSICFGPCGFNRTCDELAWHSRKRASQCIDPKKCGYVGSYTSCGSTSLLGQYASHRDPNCNFLGCHGPTTSTGGLLGSTYCPSPKPGYGTSRHGGGFDSTAYYTKRTHEDIAQQCFDIGARLCTLDELISGQP